jgi:ribosomal protein S27E
MEDGTALTVQCLACDNWMQVTKEAAMMFCPVCSTVSPVVVPEGGGPPGAAAASNQMTDDMALAEALQQEEYDKAERQEERRSKRSAGAGAAAATGAAGAKPADASSQGWMEWLGLSSSASAAKSSPERPASFAQAPAQRGYQGVSLPPGASSSSGTRSHPPSPPRMVAAQTETLSFEEDAGDDDDGILRGRGRVAAQKPLFSCVADSITSAATSLYATTLPEDEEGNVHGVDSSSLLAVTNFRRQEEEQDKK